MDVYQVCPNAFREGGVIESDRLRQNYVTAVAVASFYDYLLTLQDEASELFVMAHDYALTSNVDPMYVGRKETME